MRFNNYVVILHGRGVCVNYIKWVFWRKCLGGHIKWKTAY